MDGSDDASAQRTRGLVPSRKSKGQEGKTEEISISQNPRPLSPPPISPPRLTRIGVSGSGSGRSRQWMAAAAGEARRGSSRRRRRRSTTARSASGASMPRRGAHQPKASPLPLSCLFPLSCFFCFGFTNFCSVFLHLYLEHGVGYCH